MQDNSQTLTASARRFFSGTLMSRLTGFGREMAMAIFFGTAPAVAAFWMAFRFAHLLRRIFGEGALHLAFVPHFETLRHRDPKSAQQFFYGLCRALVICLVVLVVVIEGILWIAQSTAGPLHQESIRLTRILLPSILPIVLYAVNISFLNCQQCYFIPSVAPVFLNLIWIAAAIVLRHTPLNNAMVFLAGVLNGAFLLQWLATLPAVSRLCIPVHHKIVPLRELAALLRPFTFAVIGVTATQINSALDAVFAHFADPQGPAYLWYALRLQQLPLALFGLATVSALLPPLTRAIQKNDKAAAGHFFSLALQQTAEIMIPITAAIGVFAPSAVTLIYYHGAFSMEAVRQTTLCLQAYGGGLWPMTLVMVLAAPFYAHKRYLPPLIISLATITLNILLNALFVFVFEWGSVSIAIATSFSALFNGVLLAWAGRGLLLGNYFWKITTASIMGASAVLLYQHTCSGIWLHPVMQLTCGGGLFLLTVGGVLKITKANISILQMLKTK